MTTLRAQLRERRDEYLRRIALLGNSACAEPVDDERPAYVRRFLEGGDDLPPECSLDEQGHSRVLRRPPKLLEGEALTAANNRLGGGDKSDEHYKVESNKNERSDEADYDRFASGAIKGIDLYSITAQVVRAIELWEGGRPPPINQVLQISVTELPALSSTENSVPRSWQLLTNLLGCPADLLRTSYRGSLALASNEALTNPKYKPTGAFQSSAGGEQESPFGHRDDALIGLIGAFDDQLFQWLDSSKDDHAVVLPCKNAEPLKPQEEANRCKCKPDPAPEAILVSLIVTLDTQPRTLEQAIRDARDPLLAAFDTLSPEALVEELRAPRKVGADGKVTGVQDAQILAFLDWFTARWNDVAPEDQYASAGRVWRGRNPGRRPFLWEALDTEPDATEAGDPLWLRSIRAVIHIRDTFKYIADLSLTDVRNVCWKLVKDSYSPGSGVDAGDYGGAADRAKDTDECAFRLAALVSLPKVYLAVLDNKLLLKATEPGTGLRAPTHDPVSALYWKEVVIPSTLGHIFQRKDTADFHVASHIRFLGLLRPDGGAYRQKLLGRGELEAFVRQLVPDWVVSFATVALLGFQFWLTDRKPEQADDEAMSFWSENHQMLFASGEYIAGSWWPEEVFTETGQQGAWHRDRARERVKSWLLHRMKFGFSEVNSGTYYNQHLPGIFNLVDFSPDLRAPGDLAEDDPIRILAVMVLDVMMFDIVRRTCQGSFVAASGRAYWGSKRSGWSVSLTDTVEMLTGSIGDYMGPSENAAVCFATSRYLDIVPEALLALGVDHSTSVVDRSRTSINVADGPAYKIDYDTSRDILFWWGCSAYFTDETYEASQSWSYRWGLRKTGPFQLFAFIDRAIVRLVSAFVFVVPALGPLLMLAPVGVAAMRQSLVDGMVTAAAKAAPGAGGAGSAASMQDPSAGFIQLLNAVMMGPQVLRMYVDGLMSILDVAVGIVSWALKKVGILDENDDRVRVARPAFEQMFRQLAIDINAGSVLGRQRLCGWRAPDAMLTSLVEDTKQKTSAQKEACIAALGMNVSVFTGKRIKTPDEFHFMRTVGAGLEGYVSGMAKFAYDPETFIEAQSPWSSKDPAPQLRGILQPFALFASSKDFFSDDGPKHWFGYSSTPLVYQHQNVAIAIYNPTREQEYMSPEETHAHWPWDHFDEVRTEERSGGRWVFGRRDRRDRPRTPCPPEPAHRPSAAVPWPEGSWRDESQAAGSGYVALFSARGFKTTPASLTDWESWGHRELIADGHDNIFVMIVGDRTTHKSFADFKQAVLAADLRVDLDDFKCSITLPQLTGEETQPEKLEASWEKGGSVDGTKFSIDDWPRFEYRPATREAQGSTPDNRLVRSFSVTSTADPSKDRVDFDETGWKISVTLNVWVPVKDMSSGQERIRYVRSTFESSVTYDFADEDRPTRKLSPDAPDVTRPVNVSDRAQLLGAPSAAPDRSPLGDNFRRHHFRAARRQSR